MLKKVILVALGLGVAAGGPAVFYGVPDVWDAVRKKWFPSSSAEAPPPASIGPLGQGADGESPLLPLEGAPMRSLAEVLRFDVTTGWVLARWPRVSTGLAELPLQGYRVPLVTGTAETDLAGALTYYFNAQQQVEKICFQGTTGDARELVGLLRSRYDFARRLTNDPGMFVYEVAGSGGEPTSLLTIRSAPVVKLNDPYRRFEIELTLVRPEA
jgi:hypothetical protein